MCMDADCVYILSRTWNVLCVTYNSACPVLAKISCVTFESNNTTTVTIKFICTHQNRNDGILLYFYRLDMLEQGYKTVVLTVKQVKE